MSGFSTELLFSIGFCSFLASIVWIAFLCDGVKTEEDRKDFVEARLREAREAEDKKKKRRAGLSKAGISSDEEEAS